MSPFVFNFFVTFEWAQLGTFTKGNFAIAVLLWQTTFLVNKLGSAIPYRGDHRHLSIIDCLSFVMCPLLAPLVIVFFSFFLLRLFTVLMKQTRQVVRVIKQSIFRLSISMGETLQVVLAKFSALSQAILQCTAPVTHAAPARVKNSAQVLSFQLKFVLHFILYISPKKLCL